MSEDNFVRIGGGNGHTWGVWKCPDCGSEVQSDCTMGGLDCPDCGTEVASP